jgi:hypothetical protein
MNAESVEPISFSADCDQHYEMKSIAILICIGTLSAASMLSAQEAADADLAAKQAEPVEAKVTPAPLPSNVPELSQLDEAFKQTSMGKAGDELRLRVEWRQLRNKVMNDAELVTARRTAEAARTDLEKRENLRLYYKLYYARVRRLPMSPEMKQRLSAMETASVGLTAQTRVRPSPSVSPAKSH